MESQPNSPQPNEQSYHPKHHIKVYVWIALVVAALLVAINGYLYFLRLSYLEQGARTAQEAELRMQELRQQRLITSDENRMLDSQYILINIIAFNLRKGNIESVLAGFTKNDEKAISTREYLLKASPEDLEVFAYYFENARFIEEFGKIRVYKGPLKELNGSISDVEFMMSKGVDNIWRVSNW